MRIIDADTLMGQISQYKALSEMLSTEDLLNRIKVMIYSAPTVTLPQVQHPSIPYPRAEWRNELIISRSQDRVRGVDWNISLENAISEVTRSMVLHADKKNVAFVRILGESRFDPHGDGRVLMEWVYEEGKAV